VDGALAWADAGPSKDDTVVRPAQDPFSTSGGLRLLSGNLGRSVIKVSSVPEDRHVIEAPCRVFDSQEALHTAFDANELNQDLVCVVRWQGPQANGMPELHKLTPPLAVLQGKGFKVALVTDGRMSGASGKVPAAIHVSPEAAAGGTIATRFANHIDGISSIKIAAEPIKISLAASMNACCTKALRCASPKPLHHAVRGVVADLGTAGAATTVAISIVCGVANWAFGPMPAKLAQPLTSRARVTRAALAC